MHGLSAVVISPKQGMSPGSEACTTRQAPRKPQVLQTLVGLAALQFNCRPFNARLGGKRPLVFEQGAPARHCALVQTKHMLQARPPDSSTICVHAHFAKALQNTRTDLLVALPKIRLVDSDLGIHSPLSPALVPTHIRLTYKNHRILVLQTAHQMTHQILTHLQTTACEMIFQNLPHVAPGRLGIQGPHGQ